MQRTLQLLFRRDPARDRCERATPLEGYQVCWPDGRPVALGVDAFCTVGRRLLGLGRHLVHYRERLIELICIPIADHESRITQLAGHRVRRFFLTRLGRTGRLFFLDGTPTSVLLDLDRDERPLLDLFGLAELREGQRRWLDLAARPLEGSYPAARPPFA
jgi:hypothetical protein